MDSVTDQLFGVFAGRFAELVPGSCELFVIWTQFPLVLNLLLLVLETCLICKHCYLSL